MGATIVKRPIRDIYPLGGNDMNFGSDNVVGASEPILAAIMEAGRAGAAGTYGGDRWSDAARNALDAVFERAVAAFLVPTGTAANALALQAVTPPWGGVFCHATAHIHDDECGAPEFFTGGAKLVGLPGPAGKVAPDALCALLVGYPPGGTRQLEAAALSLSQATECGTVYTPAEIAALADVAHAHGMAVHMDGARFANALVGLGCTAAEMTWKAGVDVLSFGATKNGALACEAVVFFDDRHAARAAVQRKRGGHTLSKGRLLGAQMAAYLDGGHWLDLARHANRMAARLADGLAGLSVRMPWTRQANEIFVILPRAANAALAAAGSHHYEWETVNLPPDERVGTDETFIRLVCSFATTPADVDAFLAVARGAAA